MNDYSMNTTTLSGTWFVLRPSPPLNCGRINLVFILTCAACAFLRISWSTVVQDILLLLPLKPCEFCVIPVVYLFLSLISLRLSLLVAANISMVQQPT
ncbi:hypothetical protein BDP27DRAFT_1501334 [Rhodocollybia butyracea]|uniref:Uncharacterized protein n=1 Tax=Rhodocollybia butyracea TaxID=206335 RepID=A0A9P5PSL9_9AGAR|nr:hypothetical protein BDP27DRAFT_1501334 [Rhodocollybia butyracea]